jgi:sugar phosphate isomerase/epimerase
MKAFSTPCVWSRRRFCRDLAAGVASACFLSGRLIRAVETFQLRYVLASSMYGTTKLEEIVPEVHKTGAEHIDLWPRIHGNQREQMEAMGHDAFAALLEKHRVKVGVLTRYDLGALRLQPELLVAKRFAVPIIVTGSGGPKDLQGEDLKAAVKRFAEQMKPHAEVAGKNGVTIAIENHSNSLINSPDSLRWLAELAPTHVGIALAPYHLPQEPKLIADLVRDCGARVVHFYAWEHGKGSTQKLPKEEELMQLPGRGQLDFVPILAAL